MSTSKQLIRTAESFEAIYLAAQRISEDRQVTHAGACIQHTFEDGSTLEIFEDGVCRAYTSDENLGQILVLQKTLN